MNPWGWNAALTFQSAPFLRISLLYLCLPLLPTRGGGPRGWAVVGRGGGEDLEHQHFAEPSGHQGKWLPPWERTNSNSWQTATGTRVFWFIGKPDPTKQRLGVSRGRLNDFPEGVGSLREWERGGGWKLADTNSRRQLVQCRPRRGHAQARLHPGILRAMFLLESKFVPVPNQWFVHLKGIQRCLSSTSQ